MRICVQEEQEKFWKVFEKKLIENGEPFSILYKKAGKVTYWAVVNKNHSFVDNALSVDLLARERKLRINIYVRDNLALFARFERNKSAVQSMISVPVEWRQGTTNPNTRRIAYEIPIRVGYAQGYAEIIDKVLPVIVEMKAVCEAYAKNEFFDF